MITITKTYTVEQIKDILIKEEKSWFNVMNGIPYERRNYYIDLAIREINFCKTEQDLENFIGESRRMSLKEWCESL